MKKNLLYNASIIKPYHPLSRPKTRSSVLYNDRQPEFVEFVNSTYYA